MDPAKQQTPGTSKTSSRNQRFKMSDYTNWECGICQCSNPSVFKYCCSCNGWRFEHIFTDSTPTESSIHSSSSSTATTSSQSSSDPLFNLSPRYLNSNNNSSELTHSELTSLIISTPNIPSPDPNTPILELPWDLELLNDRGRTLLMKISVRRNTKRAWELITEAAARGHPSAQWDLSFRKSDGSDEIDWDRAVEFYVLQMQSSTPIDPNSISKTTNSNGINNDNNNDSHSNFEHFIDPELIERKSISKTNFTTWEDFLNSPNPNTPIEDVIQSTIDSNQSEFEPIDYGAIAAFCLGCCFLGGWGVERREDRAVSLYKLSIKRGYLKSLNEIAWIIDHLPVSSTNSNNNANTVPQSNINNTSHSIGLQHNGNGNGMLALACFTVLSMRGYAFSQYNTARLLLKNTIYFPNMSKIVSNALNPVREEEKEKEKETIQDRMIAYNLVLYYLSRSSEQGYHNSIRTLATLLQKRDKSNNNNNNNNNNIDPNGSVPLVAIKQDNQKAFLLYGEAAANGDGSALIKIKEWTNFTRITYLSNSVAKICCSYWKEFNPKEQKLHDQKLHDQKFIDQKSNEQKLNAGQWRVPKLEELCRKKVYGGKGLVESKLCIAGCGEELWGKGRVTRSFVYMKLIWDGKSKQWKDVEEVKREEGKRKEGKLVVEKWKAFGEMEETEGVWRETKKVVRFGFCGGNCGQKFMQKGLMCWEF
eukprot:TRINITY_DN213_c1_g1_i1.p1 TRINITY_DN213_c1_g1~~TRINITY_DN213_c1_g1_i1.p1  ORF type:complete len:703 (-),score=206.73 TRINITY_DN213_c1_g1_i1:57-2165(-)